MDGDSLRSVRPGDSINIEAATWNSVMETARAFRAGRLDIKGGGGSSGERPITLEGFVQNITGATAPAGSILKYFPGNSGIDFYTRPFCFGDVPNSYTDRFCVTLEDIGNNDFGRAVFAGPAHVTFESSGGSIYEPGGYARPIPGVINKVAYGATGTARLVSSTASYVFLGQCNDGPITATLTSRSGGVYSFRENDSVYLPAGYTSRISGDRTGDAGTGYAGSGGGDATDLSGAADDALIGAVVKLYQSPPTGYEAQKRWTFGPYKKVVADIVPASPGPGFTVSYRWCIGTPLSATTSTVSPTPAVA